MQLWLISVLLFSDNSFRWWNVHFWLRVRPIHHFAQFCIWLWRECERETERERERERSFAKMQPGWLVSGIQRLTFFCSITEDLFVDLANYVCRVCQISTITSIMCQPNPITRLIKQQSIVSRVSVSARSVNYTRWSTSCVADNSIVGLAFILSVSLSVTYKIVTWIVLFLICSRHSLSQLSDATGREKIPLH